MASKYQLLFQERHDLKAEGQMLLENGDRTPAESARLVEITSKVKTLNEQIEEEEIKREALRNEARNGAFRDQAPGSREGGTGPKFAQMFGAAQANADFRSFGEFASAVNSGMWHPGFQSLMAPGDSTGTGLMIPTQFAARLWDQALEDEVVRPRARIEPMTSDEKVIAGLSHSDGTDAPFGISGSWTEPGEEIAVDDPNVRSITLHAHKLAALVQVSNEAAADGTSIDSQLSSALGRGLGWLLDRAFLTGTGAGQPLGVLNAPVTIEVAAEAGQDADTIIYENLVKMFARLHPSSVGNSVWVANVGSIPQLLTLVQLAGVGGSQVPVMRESNGQFNILTRPVVFTEKVPALGDRGDIGLYDFSQYAVGLREQIVIEKSAHVGFTRDTTYYRCKVRADGQPTWDAAYTPLNGATLSPFVVLAAR